MEKHVPWNFSTKLTEPTRQIKTAFPMNLEGRESTLDPRNEKTASSLDPPTEGREVKRAFNFPVPETYAYLSGTWKLKLAKPKVEGTPTVGSILKK